VVLRRVLPFAPAAIVAAFAIGFVAAGSGAAWSAALGVLVVAVNLVVLTASISWAARISPAAIYGVSLGGFVVRLMVFTLLLVALDATAWFSTPAFIAAFVPATIALLAVELKILSSRRLEADLWYFRPEAP
jgi:hypothetical protein